MYGQTKSDARTLQCLQLLDDDVADNLIAVALYRNVLHECPKKYVSYEQRLRKRSPLAVGAVLKPTSTQLTNSGGSLTQPASGRQGSTDAKAVTQSSLLYLLRTFKGDYHNCVLLH
jgi:hypothetical protein